MDALTIRVHASPAEAEQDLETPGLAGYAFGRFAWLQAWHTTLGANAKVKVAIVVVADAGVRMVLPLGVARRGGLRIVEFLGAPVTDYNAPLVDPTFAAALDTSSMQVLWARVLGALPPHDIVRLLAMPAVLDAPSGAGEPSVPNPLSRLAGVRAAGQGWSRSLPDSYAALSASLKVRFVKDTERLHRRLAEVGPVSLKVPAAAAGMRDVVTSLKRMKSRRWIETKDRDWFADPAFAGFYEAVSRIDLPDGRVHGTLLSVGDTPVAAHLGLAYRGRFYLLLVGWEAGEWRRFGTGRLIVDRLMGVAIDDGLKVFDFTVGDEAYKKNWVDIDLPLYRCETAITGRGQVTLSAARMLDGLRARAKRLGWLRATVRWLAGRPPRPAGGGNA